MKTADRSMTEQKSQYLHCLRWISALVVVIGHSQLIGHGGDAFFVFLASHSHAAVMVFFVLSGYVIVAAVEKRRASGYTIRDYFLDRVSRIYSVLLPAVALTVLLDSVGKYFFVGRYSDPSLIPQTAEIIRFFINVLCLQGIWGYRVQFGSNPALWSIGYEFFYYVVFGLFAWRPRYWKLTMIALVLIVGPKVLIYGSIWALGVIAYKANKSGFSTPFPLSLGLFLCANYFLQYSAPAAIPEFFRDFLFSTFVALLVMSSPNMNVRFFRANREMADFSFSLYAYHMPIMFFAYSFITPSLPASWAMVGFSLLSARAIYIFTEGRRSLLRSALERFLIRVLPVGPK